MAKSALRRHHANRIMKNWKSLSRSLSGMVPEDQLSFGRVYSKDPFDCGTPNCGLCSYGKNVHPKMKRLESKKELHAVIRDTHPYLV
jgi:hypothetical protein